MSHSEPFGTETVPGKRDSATSAASGTATMRRTPSSAPAHPAPVLTVGAADDPMERQADAMADGVVARLDAVEPHRHTPGCGHLRRSAAPAGHGATIGLEGGTLDTEASSAIERARGGGRALPEDVRRRMEGAFGTSLAHVRVHDGPRAAKLSSAMQASAFTTGSDVFFGAGQFDPASREGEHILAHELAHVVTEGSAGVRRIVIRRSPRGWLTKGLGAAKGLFGKAKKYHDVTSRSKKVEKGEIAHHQGERARGAEAREATVTEIYGDDPTQRPTSDVEREQQAERLKNFGARFEEVLEQEREKIAELKEKYGDSKTEEEIAKEAYDEVWLNAPEDLRARRPARETKAEKLVAQVRQVEAGANAQQGAVDSVAETTKLGGMLSKTVEGAYDVMVLEAVRLRNRSKRAAKKSGATPMTRQEAREAVRPLGVKHCEDQAVVRKHSKPRELPQEGTRLDDAAWDDARKRFKVRRLKTAQDEAAIDRLQSQLGAGEDATERKDDTKDLAGGAVVDLSTGIAAGVGDATAAGGEQVAETPGRFAKVKAFFTGTKAPEVPERDDYDTPLDKFDQGTDGAQAAGGVVSKLAGAVSEALAMARHIKAAVKSGDPWESVRATKAGLGSVNGLVSGASETAKLARSIQPSLSKKVAGVVPGLGVATAVIDTSRAILDVAMAGRRQHETDVALYEARTRTTDSEADVLVWPLLKMTQAHTKTLENNVWGLGKSVFDMITAIAELGTAGAAKTAKLAGSVVDSIHSLGHLIADEIITWQAKRAKKLSSVLHLEGAAQDELRMHPGMAVGSIIVEAAKGDEKAIAYLCNYWVDGQQVTPELIARIKVRTIAPAPKDTGEVVDPKDISQQDTGRESDDIVFLKIREAVLADMNTEGDPKSVFDKLRAGVASAKGLFGLRDKWRKTGEMAQVRNAHAEDDDYEHTRRSDRGVGWRLKMMLKGEEKFKRSAAKTAVLQDADDAVAEKERRARVKRREELPPGIACAIGPHKLAKGASEDEAAALFAKATDAQLEREIERTPARNSEGWIEVMREELLRRTKARKSARAQGGSASANTTEGQAPSNPSKSDRRSASAAQVGS